MGSKHLQHDVLYELDLSCLMSDQVHESVLFIGSAYARKLYAWGDIADDGSRYVRTLRRTGEVYGSVYHHHPREFKMIGLLQNGLECNLGDLNSLASCEPTALLVAGDMYALQKEQDRVLESCRELEAGVTQPGLERIASLTKGDGVVLTFPKLVEVSYQMLSHGT